MRQDTVLNLTVMIIIILLIIFLNFITQYNSKRKMQIFLKTKVELQLLAKKIQEYYDTYQTYPIAINDKRFKNFIDDISLTDNFDPEKRQYRYKVTNGNWKLYSVGPNKIDDGGIMFKEKKLLDIVVRKGEDS